LIATLHKPIYRGCFTLVYAYGLRIGEAITLPVTAVDSQQLLLRVIGKGNKERALPLTEVMLDMLREVWKTHRSTRWLFPSQAIVTPLSYGSARAAFVKARTECGFDHRFRPHSLRQVRSYYYISLREGYLKGISACFVSPRRSWRPVTTACTSA
jgi:site-specific recombinase XerD